MELVVQLLHSKGGGCGTKVDNSPRHPKVTSLNLASWWDYFYTQSSNNCLMEGYQSCVSLWKKVPYTITVYFLLILF